MSDAKSWFAAKSDCPCCNKTLNRQAELRQIQFEADLTMELWGLSPTTIMEVAAAAIGFWEYQRDQEVAWQNHQIKKLKSDALAKEKTHKEAMVEVQNAINSYNHQIGSLKEDLKRAKKAYSTLDNDLQEKIRQCKKYEQLYKAQRPSSISSPGLPTITHQLSSFKPPESSTPRSPPRAAVQQSSSAMFLEPTSRYAIPRAYGSPLPSPGGLTVGPPTPRAATSELPLHGGGSLFAASPRRPRPGVGMLPLGGPRKFGLFG